MPHEHRIENYRATFGIITCSSTRTRENDESGMKIMELVQGAGHDVLEYAVVDDDSEKIKDAVRRSVLKCDAVIISGGTGITSRDVTVDAVRSISQFEMTGFGHVFAILSYNRIGTSAVMSRSTAFVVDRKPVFCLPGSPEAADLGVRHLILDQIDHIHHELVR